MKFAWLGNCRRGAEWTGKAGVGCREDRSLWGVSGCAVLLALRNFGVLPQHSDVPPWDHSTERCGHC